MPTDIETIIVQAYEKFADPIFRYCFLRVPDRELARDIMQDTFTRTWNYLRKGKEIQNIRAFLYRTANNLIIDNSRKPKTSSLDYLQEKGFVFRHHTNKDALETKLDSADIVERIKKLDEKYKTVLLLRYVDDLSLKEIAHIVGETENTVSVRVHRGLEHIRVRLAKDEQQLHRETIA